MSRKTTRTSLIRPFITAAALLLASLIAAGAANAADVRVAWGAPTTNTNGAALTDLAGYKLHYGTAPGSYSRSITVGNVTAYTVTGLANGTTYYFAATAYNAAGVESAYSNEITVAVPSVSRYTLTVGKSGGGSGTVTGPGISCGADCTELYNQGTVVTLTAAAAAGSVFSGWSGPCSGTGTCTVTMNAATTITAAFTASASSYSITASAGAGGTISPSGTITAAQGSSVAFTIAPAAGYRIADVRVDGASVGAVSSYTFTAITAGHTIAASFSASAQSGETVYENAEDGTIRGWSVYDSDPAGAAVSNVYDTARGSRVIRLSGSGLLNGYRLLKDDLTRWGNTGQFIVQWSMRYYEDFTIYLELETSAGRRYVVYRPLNTSSLGAGEYVSYGLGSSAKDGTWRTYTRDLRADLQKAQPGVTILRVNAFLIRGSGRVDDIKLKSAF